MKSHKIQYDLNNFFKFQMNLRYSANIMKFEDGMKKISAIAWSSTGKKLAIASADKVLIYLITVGLSL